MGPRLYVNVDHVATLRQQRGTTYPDPVVAAALCELAGAEGITVHLREDRRHIQDRDVRILRETVRGTFNLEMAATEEMLGIALATKPHFCTLVPEKRSERTTEGGLDVRVRPLATGAADGSLERVVNRLRDAGIGVSLFIDPEPESVVAAQRLGASTVELHTGYFCDAVTRSPDAERQLRRLHVAAQVAGELQLRLGAGHGLDYSNVDLVARLPHLEELNIGHGLIARGLMLGLERAVGELRALISAAASAGAASRGAEQPAAPPPGAR
jgi:pyridoxine 5-phosphate synthase